MKEYYKYSTDEFVKKAHFPVIVKKDNDTIFRELAKIMYDTIKKNNDNNEISVLVNPVGPTAHYKYFVEMVNENKLSLKNCWFINMDEYLTDDNESTKTIDSVSVALCKRMFMTRLIQN